MYNINQADENPVRILYISTVIIYLVIKLLLRNIYNNNAYNNTYKNNLVIIMIIIIYLSSYHIISAYHHWCLGNDDQECARNPGQAKNRQ